MENKVVRKAIINTVAATHDNVLSVAASGPYPGCVVICESASVTPPVELLPPMTKGTIKWITKTISQAEITQIAVVGKDDEVIVASTRYKIEIGCPYDKYESHTAYNGIYAYTSPAVLSGTAATDRLNVYTALVNKINADSRNHCTAYLMYKVAFTVGSNAVPEVGATGTQATSLATFKVAAVDIASNDFTGDDATGTIWVYDVSGTWSDASLVTTINNAGTDTLITTAAALTHTGLVVVDDAGYYPAQPQLRKGINEVALTAGFSTAIVECDVNTLAMDGTGVLNGRKGQYAIGIGTRMLTDVPSWNRTKDDAISGEAGFQLNAAPVAGTTYTLFRFGVDVSPTDNVLTHYGFVGPFVYELWAAEDAGRTNIDAMEAYLETVTGLTIA